MTDYINEEASGTAESFEVILEEAEKFAGNNGRIKNKLTKEKIKAQIDRFSEKAKQIIDNPEKVSTVLEKAADLCDDLSHVRFIGKYFKDISLICSMINDYICKRYTKVPMATVITLLAAVLYFISPIDIIPDFLPLIGHMDDMLVFAFVQDAAKVDLKKYEKWKKEQEKEAESVSEKNKSKKRLSDSAPFLFLLHSAAVVVTTATVIAVTAVIAVVTAAAAVVAAESIAAVTAEHE